MVCPETFHNEYFSIYAKKKSSLVKVTQVRLSWKIQKRVPEKRTVTYERLHKYKLKEFR